MAHTQYRADWWQTDYDSAWDRVKAAFRRDWEQTKHDFGGDAPDLDQDVDDTVKQAVGKQEIPPGNQPNFDEYEPAFRFGYGARQYYGNAYPRWDDKLETRLEQDWGMTGDMEWRRYRSAIRRGYDYQTASTGSNISGSR